MRARNLLILNIPLFISVALYTSVSFSPRLAASVDLWVGRYIRTALSSIFSVFSFSVFELVLLSSPIIIISAVVYISASRGVRAAGQRFTALLSVLGLLSALYIFTLGIPMKKVSLAESDRNLSPIEKDAELIEGADRLISELSKLCDASPMRDEEIADELEASAYKLTGIKQKLYKPKKIKFSRLFSYTGASALYSFPTGEVNLNPSLPSYMIPFVLAHEYAHFLGAPSEGDAEIFAFSACMSSEALYIKYSGILSALEYLLTDIYKISPEMYTDIYKTIPECAKKDMLEYKMYSDKYKKGRLFCFFEASSRRYLSAVDKNGMKGYSEAAKYILNYINNRL